jgi:hypothetical protein
VSSDHIIVDALRLAFVNVDDSTEKKERSGPSLPKGAIRANSGLYASETGVSSSSDRGLVDPQSLPLAQTH